MTPGAFKDLQAPFADVLKSLFQGSPSTVFSMPQSQAAQSGQMVAPITAPEQQQLGALQNSGMGRQGYLENVIGGQYLPGQQGSNPFLQAAIEAAQRPTLQGLTETLGRTLPGRFTQGGQFTQPNGSSAFDRAAAIATTGAANTMGDIATNMSSQNFEAERGRQQQAVQLGQQEVQTMVTNLQAQGLPRLIQDMGIERGLQEFNVRLNALMQALGLMGQTTRPVVGQQSETNPNIVGTVLGGLKGTALGAVGGLGAPS
jgi:hypothetical protein